ncbi:DUF397 domain-containing protein [Streptomyces sp. NPDC091279]|uniref:DUF397 domain-containing protein n=1 Tax=Streptomyces sp. NPDC091279 TaxID=3365983 RepID=UPI00380000E6
MLRAHAVSTELAPEGAWFKSSYSSQDGGNCIEVADLNPEGAWFKSSFSTPEGGNCVEVADLNPQVGVRDSKNVAGPALAVRASAWSAFVGLARSESVEL